MDGLLENSDVSWTRNVTNSDEVFEKGDRVRCVVLDVDQGKQRISLGVKQIAEDGSLSFAPDEVEQEYDEALHDRAVVAPESQSLDQSHEARVRDSEPAH